MTTEPPLHRHFLHYSELPYSMRVLYTATMMILGMAYLFAGIYLFHTYAGKDGNPRSLSYDDLVVAYSGSGKGSRLETALASGMSEMLPAEERDSIIAWVRKGADPVEHAKTIKPLMETRCIACHDGKSNPHLTNLSTYESMKKILDRDTGANIFTLVRVSHIHLFGVTFIFFLMGLIFAHAYVRPVWLKCTLMALPFACIATDVSSWYLVKLFHPFAYLTMAAGALMAASFTAMWVIAMYQLWFAKIPAAVRERRGTIDTLVG
ncbi:MAG: hypothetical protein ACKVQK_13380 [Burkholderiales bacterium]